MSKEYLKEHRLGEVIALIQVLAFHRNTSRSEEGLIEELKLIPRSANSWVELSKSHPELFRVRDEEDKINRVSLVSRYVASYEAKNGKKIRERLEPSLVQKLIEVAIEIHDRQVSNFERWKVIVPLLVACISATAVITATLMKIAN
ncbi:hypothetical protein WNY97_10600 [Pseudoalteromonas fuliginea]|uniref:hypothetical protein n=1 Tax=Pseudoalteromonas fuliginea TaxID=1872678 RepID=UPI00317BC872